MVAVITHPKGVYSGANTQVAKHFLEGSFKEIINPSDKLSSEERLSIYQRAYYARLLECFSAEYPALKHFLGTDLFNAFVVDYLQYHPSRSYTLHQLGAQFPAYLARTQPNQETSGATAVDWICFILELAMLERAYMEVYDGPGHEKDTLPNADHILRLGPDLFGNLKLIPAHCLRLFAFQQPVHEYLMAVRKGLAPGQLPAPQPTFIALTRQHYKMRFLKLSQLDYNLLHSICAGHSIPEAIVQLPDELKGPPEASLIAIRSSLCTLADEGFFQEVIAGNCSGNN